MDEALQGVGSARNSVYTLPSEHARKLAGTGFKKSHRHTISDEFHMEPPDSTEQIERMFNEVMATRDFGNLPEKARRQMENYSPDRKWMLIRQHKLAEFKKEKMREQEQQRDTKRASSSRLSTVSASGMIRRSKGPGAGPKKQQSEPNFYVEQLISNEITLEQLKELDICLSSEEIAWTRRFLEQEGALCLCNVLNNLYKTYPLIPSGGGVDPEARERDQKNLPVAKKLFTNISEDYDCVLEKELRLFRCIKVIADLSVGIEYLKKSGIFIQAIFGGLFSCKPQVRKWATDIIVYFYHKTDYGATICRMMHEGLSINVHYRFLKALYARPDNSGGLDDRSRYILANGDTVKRFEVWIWGVGRLFSGRGRMGSKVGVYSEFRYSGTVSDGFLVEYALSTLLLMNTLVQRSQSLAERIQVRREFAGAGMKDAFESFRKLQSTDVDHSLASMEQAEQADQVELRQMEEFKNSNIDFNDPVSLFEVMWRKSRHTEAGRHLLSMMQTLFVSQSGSLTKADPASVQRSFKLVDNFVNNITLASGDDSTDMNISLNKLLSSYQSEEVARRAMAEAADAKKRLQQVEAEKANALQQLNEGSEGVIQQMKKEVSERDMLMRRLRQKIDERDKEVSELKRKRILDKHQQEMEMREMLLLLHSYQVQGRRGATLDASNSSSGPSGSGPSSSSLAHPSNSRLSSRSPAVTELENRLKTKVGQSKLEARRLGSVSVEPSAKLRDLRLKMDLLEREARDLENMDFEEFQEKIPDPPAKSDRQADLQTLAALRKKLDSLQMDANKVIKVQSDLSKQDAMKKKRFEALDRLSKLQRYAEDLRISELEKSPNTGKSHSLDPKLQKSNSRSARLRGELDSIEALCKNLKDTLTSDKSVSNVGTSSGGVGAAPAARVQAATAESGSAAAQTQVPTAQQLLSKFEDRYSRGRKVQPRVLPAMADVPGPDREAAQPFLGELQRTVARRGAIDDEGVDAAVRTGGAKTGGVHTGGVHSGGLHAAVHARPAHAPSSTLPVNPALQPTGKPASSRPAKLKRVTSSQSDSHRHHHHHHHHRKDEKSRTKHISSHHHYVDGSVSVDSFDANVSSSQDSIGSHRISAGSGGRLSTVSTYTGEESIAEAEQGVNGGSADGSRSGRVASSSSTVENKVNARPNYNEVTVHTSGKIGERRGGGEGEDVGGEREDIGSEREDTGGIEKKHIGSMEEENGRFEKDRGESIESTEIAERPAHTASVHSSVSRSLSHRKSASRNSNTSQRQTGRNIEADEGGEVNVRHESINYGSRRASEKLSVISMGSGRRSNVSSMMSDDDEMMSAEEYDDDDDDDDVEIESAEMASIERGSVRVRSVDTRDASSYKDGVESRDENKANGSVDTTFTENASRNVFKDNASQDDTRTKSASKDISPIKRRHITRRKKIASNIEVESSDFDTSEDVFSDAEESVSPRKKAFTGSSSKATLGKNLSNSVKLVKSVPVPPPLPPSLSPVVEQVEEMPERTFKQVVERHVEETQIDGEESEEEAGANKYESNAAGEEMTVKEVKVRVEITDTKHEIKANKAADEIVVNDKTIDKLKSKDVEHPEEPKDDKEDKAVPIPPPPPPPPLPPAFFIPSLHI